MSCVHCGCAAEDGPRTDCNAPDGDGHLFDWPRQPRGGTSSTLHLGDCIDWLRSLEAESVDCVVTDPAYESLEKHRKIGSTTRLKKSDGSSNEWFPIFKNERFHDFFLALFRVMKKNTHLYIFCDEETADVAKPIGRAAGFTFWKSIIWDKMVPGMGYHYRAQNEKILFFEKGKRRLNNNTTPDVLSVRRITTRTVDGRTVYPTEKPEGLASLLIANSTNLKDLVIDPFVGSGVFGVDAAALGRRFAGCDVVQGALDVASARIDLAYQHRLLRGEP